MAGNFKGGKYDGSQFTDKYVFMKGSVNHTPIIPDYIELENGLMKETCWLEVENTLEIVDSVQGCFTDGEYHDFILIPRKDAISERMMGGGKGEMQKELFGVFQQLEHKTPVDKCRVDNVQRIRMTNGSDSKYIVIGTSPNRGGRHAKGRGTRESMKGLEHPESVVHQKLFGIWFRRVEHCVDRYLPSYLKTLVGMIGKMCGHGNMPLGNNKYSNIWPALAVGRNVFLNVHTDEDYFWTLTTVVTDEIPTTNSPIVLYMCFPTLGTAVGLRNGDLLMFNPLIPHCVSTRCNPNTEVYCVSMYMKSLLVGGADNSQVLSQDSKDSAKFVLDNCTRKRVRTNPRRLSNKSMHDK